MHKIRSDTAGNVGLTKRPSALTMWGDFCTREAQITMKILCQVGILFAVCWVSQLVETLLPIPFPASVLGMVLLFLLLCTKRLRVEHIREKSDFLLANMAFFFVPAGVSILEYVDLLRSSVVQMVVICTVSAVVTFAAAAYSVKLTLWLMGKAGSHA